jgi:hypothetical protein
MATSDSTVQRNFQLPVEQAEWLREHAFHTRRKQVDVVREALAEYRARAEAAPADPSHTRNRALVERFSHGIGVDLDLLRDEDGQMWRHDG